MSILVYLIKVNLAVVLSMLIGSGLKFRHLFRSMGPARRIMKGKVRVYVQDQQMGSFTLFRRIYLDRHAFAYRSRFVLKHEMAHAIQVHSFDLLFMEFVRALVVQSFCFRPIAVCQGQS